MTRPSRIGLLFVLIVSSLCSCKPAIDLTIDNIVQEGITLNDYVQGVDDKGVPKEVPITVRTNQIMTVKYDYPPSPQGGACWNDFFIQFTADNGIIWIFNLKEKKLIQKCTLLENNRGFVSNCHCNSVCFGSSYFKEGDEFPLLYVSTGYASDGYTGALVYRVIRDKDKFSFSPVQTIRLPVLKSFWTEFIPDGDYCYVCYTSDTIVYKMRLPSVNDGDVILDGSKDAIEVFQFPPQPEEIKSSRNQGRMFHNGKIIYPSGVPGAGEASILFILDLKTRTYEHIFDFPSMGFPTESESIFFWKDKLCISFVDQIVSFEFTPDILNNND